MVTDRWGFGVGGGKETLVSQASSENEVDNERQHTGSGGRSPSSGQKASLLQELQLDSLHLASQYPAKWDDLNNDLDREREA